MDAPAGPRTSAPVSHYMVSGLRVPSIGCTFLGSPHDRARPRPRPPPPRRCPPSAAEEGRAPPLTAQTDALGRTGRPRPGEARLRRRRSRDRGAAATQTAGRGGDADLHRQGAADPAAGRPRPQPAGVGRRDRRRGPARVGVEQPGGAAGDRPASPGRRRRAHRGADRLCRPAARGGQGAVGRRQWCGRRRPTAGPGSRRRPRGMAATCSGRASTSRPASRPSPPCTSPYRRG